VLAPIFFAPFTGAVPEKRTIKGHFSAICGSHFRIRTRIYFCLESNGKSTLRIGALRNGMVKFYDCLALFSPENKPAVVLSNKFAEKKLAAIKKNQNRANLPPVISGATQINAGENQ